MKRIALSVAMLAISLLGALSGAPIANAASEFDNSILTTDNLTIKSYGNPGSYHDITETWQDLIIAGQYCSVEEALSFERRTMYSVSKIGGQEWQTIAVNWIEEGETPWTGTFSKTEVGQPWETTNLTLTRQSSSPTHGAYIQFNNGQPSISCNDGSYFTQGIATTYKNEQYHYAHTYLYANTFPITYPQGYEGMEYHNVGGGSTTDPLDYKPDIKMDTLSKWEAKFSDQNFFTFDNVPFTCGDGFPPRVTMEIWDKTNNEMLLSETVSANSDLGYTFPKKTMNMDYEIVAWYSCTDGTAFVEPGASFYNFTIDMNGSLVAKPNMEACLSQEYPFVRWEGCVANLSQGLDALSFGTVSVGASSGQWSFTEGCHTLGTVGDWLNLDNRTVCPAIPTSIRNIITPFVTFAMGLMTIKFLSRIKAEGF